MTSRLTFTIVFLLFPWFVQGGYKAEAMTGSKSKAKDSLHKALHNASIPTAKLNKKEEALKRESAPEKKLQAKTEIVTNVTAPKKTIIQFVLSNTQHYFNILCDELVTPISRKEKERTTIAKSYRTPMNQTWSNHHLPSDLF